MKKLREGFTTGSCAAAASLASVIWQTEKKCPGYVEIDTPSGRIFKAEIIPLEYGKCGVIKDGGDDPDVTDKCMICSEVIIYETDGDIIFEAGEGVGTITRDGLKLPVGQPAINPVPRNMIEKAVRKIIYNRAAKVIISVPGGEETAEKTFNLRLGITGGLSILGTTGIVRPMSEEAVKESLSLELSMYRSEGNRSCAFVTGYSGEKFLNDSFPDHGPIVLCSNYLGYLLDEAKEMGFENILLAGGTGKLIKPAANIMYLHSHTAGGQREIICTHAAMLGADTEQIKELYNAATTMQADKLLSDYGLRYEVWKQIAEESVKNCMMRARGTDVAMILTDSEDRIIAKTGNAERVIEKWRRSV